MHEYVKHVYCVVCRRCWLTKSSTYQVRFTTNINPVSELKNYLVIKRKKYAFKLITNNKQ